MAYGASTIKRRSCAQMEWLRQCVRDVVGVHRPLTVRQAYYRLVAEGVIDKTHAEYRAVQRQVLELRRRGAIPYGWITDSTRWIMHNDFMLPSLEAALDRTISLYRRDVWASTPAYVEIWAESDAVAGVLYQEAETWGVPVIVFRGFSSETFLYTLAEQIRADGRPAFIYYFGDWDPSGDDIARDAESRVLKFVRDVPFTFERVAVTPEQVQAWGLPTRPPAAKDPRAKNFKGGAVEIEAIAPGDLRRLVRKCITRHIDGRTLDMSARIEQQERETLTSGTAGWIPS